MYGVEYTLDRQQTINSSGSFTGPATRDRLDHACNKKPSAPFSAKHLLRTDGKIHGQTMYSVFSERVLKTGK